LPEIKGRTDMNLGMVLNAPYPPDMRVKKETDALTRAGIKIHLMCIRKDGQKYEEEIAGISVTRIDAGKNNVQLALRDAIMSVTFRHPEFMRALPAWLTKNNISVLHVHDLPLAGTALALKKKRPLRVVVDLHENYPEALRTWFEWRKGILVKIKDTLFMNPDRWTKLEHRAVHDADHVIAVVDEMKNRLVSEHKIDPKKVIVISNTEEKSFLNQSADPSVYKDFENKFRILYSGGIGPHRGIDTVIEGMKYLKEFPEIVFIIIGSGNPDVMSHLRKLVSQHGVEKQVHFLGYQPFQQFYSFMHYADVNIIPHKSNGHTDNTIPHKLFQSMMSGRPVLVSSSDPLRRIVGSTNSGLIFKANDPQDFAAEALKLYRDKSLRDMLASNGFRATAEGELNWDHEQASLIHFYRELLTSES
jgi:glycosyltransferase involved in cell wall biosynthesis